MIAARPTRATRLRRAALVGLALALAGCAQTGDFGRAQPSALDPVIAFVGDGLATRRGEPVSSFTQTDDEHELRDRAYRFLMPSRPRGDFDALLADLARRRVLPASAIPDERPGYIMALTGRDSLAGMASGRFADIVSSHTPYRRLIDDILADDALIDPLCDVIDRVRAADGVRRQGLPHVSDLPTPDRDRALVRIAENQALVGWIGAAVGRRVATDRTALHRLFVEVPENDGVEAERALAAFEHHVLVEACTPSAGAAGLLTGPLGQGDTVAVYKP